MEVYIRKKFIQHFIQLLIQYDLKMLDEMLDWFVHSFI